MEDFKRNILMTGDAVAPVVTCKKANVTISSIDADASDDGTVWLDYTNCAGDPTSLQYPDAGSYPGLCVDHDTSFAFYYYVGGVATNAGSSGALLTSEDCGT